MKRKFFAMLLVLTMVFSMALGVSAEETGADAALTLDVTQGKGSVTIAVYLEGCDGVTNGRFCVAYDADALTLAEVQTTGAYAMSSANDETAGQVAFAWVGSELTEEKTLMVTLLLETEGITQDMSYTVEADGIYIDTEAVEVCGDSVTIGYTVPVDTTELEKAIDAAKGLTKDDYTKESYAKVKTTLAEAIAVLADSDATQDEVDAAAKALTDAIAALVSAESDATDKPTSSDGTEDTEATVPAGDGDSAETGDHSNIALWTSLLIVSGIGIGVMLYWMVRSGKQKQANRFIAMLLVVIMVGTIVPTNAFAVTVSGEDISVSRPTSDEALHELIKDKISGLTDSKAGTVTEIENPNADLKLEQVTDEVVAYAEDEMVRIIVELEGDCLLEQGYTQGQISAYGDNVAADAAKLEQMQDNVSGQVEEIVSESGLVSDSEAAAADVKYNYTVAMNGMALTVPYGTLNDIRQISGVKGAYVVSQYQVPETGEADFDTSMYATAGSFGSAQTWSELGYTGQGMLIAIIDTGLDLDHPSFADAPEGASLTLEDIDNVLTELNAYRLYSNKSAVNLTADKLYRSEKVPFGFNYVDEGLDVTHDYDDQGDHGTHVAGIAAANRLDSTSVVGVAPDAQLVIIKVFGKNGGAYSDDIMAAIEDCILLGVDVINMSLGAQAGFSEDSQLISEVYGRILENDMILAVAAGNANSAATGNNLGTNLNLTGDPDNGLVNSPATYLASTTVASLENVAMMMPYFSVGENKVAYVDVTYYNFAALAGTYEYVVVPGLGDVSDYEGLDVVGKIALVQRGTIDFVAKQQNAYTAGAAALVVYDNVDGDLVSMYDGEFLPNVFISKADGEKMIAAAENGVGTMVIHPYGEETAIPNSAAGLLSDFSCWGVTPDLQLTPDVTAPGGMIYSCYTDGAYGTMSGTSMASPHVAGMSALVLQYLHDKYPGLEPSEYHVLAEALVMCTAVPVYDSDGILYSPRKQGAGAANVYSAVTSPVYLTSYQEATGEYTPKGSLGDDPDRTGEFTFSFEMHNLTDAEQIYMLDGMLLTDQFAEIDGVEYMGETGRNLTGDVVFEVLNTTALLEYDANKDGRTDMLDVQFMLDVANGLQTLDADMVDMMDLCDDGVLNTVDAQLLYLMLLDGFEAQTLVTVPANASITVNVTVTLSDDDIAYMEEHYANGIYVDGFIRAYAQTEGAVDLSLPFVGFYGDWTDARMFDNGWYYDAEANDYDLENDNYYNRYLNVVFATMGPDVTTAGGLGLNPYVLEDYDPAHNVLSPNGDYYYDYVPDIYISLMRSAELLDFTWTDEEGNELFYEWYAYARKSYYWSGYGMCLPAIYTDAGCEPFTFYDESGKLMVEDLDRLTLTIRGYLDDGDLDDIGYNEDGDPIPDPEDADDMVQIPVVIDLQAPKMDISSVTFSTEDGRNYVTFDVEDNYDIAAVIALTVGGDAYEYIPVNTKEAGKDGEKDTIKIDITDFDATFQIVLCDYGCNETYYELTNAAGATLSGDKFYGFRRYCTPVIGDAMYMTDQLNGWYSFETADEMMMHTSQPMSGEATVYAAEYVDGYIIGAQDGGSANGNANTLFAMKAGSWERIQIGDNRSMRKTVYQWPGSDKTYFLLNMIALDMTYDYTRDTMYILANALENNYFPEGLENLLLKVDILTGEVTLLGFIEPAEGEEFLALTLAADNDGVLYTVNYNNGQLYTIDVDGVKSAYGDDVTEISNPMNIYTATSVDADGKVSYYPAAYTQSMTVDHETGKLYWAAYQGKTGVAYFFELDKENGDLLSVTETEDNAEISGLFKPWDSGEDIIPEAELEGINLKATDLYLSVGQTTNIIVTPEPYNAELGTFTYTCYDESVATVNEFGMVQGVGVGSTMIEIMCETEYDDFYATCFVNVNQVEGDMFAYSDGYWLLMDAGKPYEASQIIDAAELEGEVKASAYLNGYIYAAAVIMDYDADWNEVYTTNLYKLDAATLQGELIGSCDAEITALAYNYADGFMYGMTRELDVETWSYNYDLIRVNINTAEILKAASLNSIFDNAELYETCTGALAIDYEGNFYVTGDNEYGEYELVRFNLDENDQLQNVTAYAGLMSLGYEGEAMVWSEENGGIIRATLNEFTYTYNLSWIDVTDMSYPIEIDLGEVRGGGYPGVFALAMILGDEPESETVAPTDIMLEESYSVHEGETVTVIPTLDPWNAAAEYEFVIADESIATVNEKGVITGVAVGETTVTATVVGTELSATAKVIVLENPGYLYGFFQADMAQGITLEMWTKIPVANSANSSYMSKEYDFTIYAGAYYDGYVYAYGQSQTDYLYYFLKIDPSNFSYEIMCQGELMVRDMAFDYTTGTMYVIGYTDDISGGLYQMDLQTGALTLVSEAGEMLVTLACDDEGTLYAADQWGEIWVYNDGWWDYTGISGSQSQYLQAMTYDYNNDTIYWAVNGSLYEVAVSYDADNGEYSGSVTKVGLADVNSGEMATAGCVVSALFSVPRTEVSVPETVEPNGVALAEKNTVAVGETLTIEAVVLPVSVATVDQKLTWSSDDETVATVDENGVVTGVSAGQVYIYAEDVNGNMDYILITVTAEHRYFYAYDEISQSWVSFDADGKIINTWADDKDLSPIVAAQYIGETLYAYDADGYFYTIDTDSFERTKIGDGIHGLNATLEANEGDGLYFVEAPYEMVDMTYYTVSRTGLETTIAYGVMVAYNISRNFNDFSYKIVEIDLTTGEVWNEIVADELVDHEMSLRPTNLLYRNGSLYTVNGYISGMVTKIDMDNGNSVEGCSIFANYWGDFNSGRSLIEDPLTGEVYAIRDMRTPYIESEDPNNPVATSELCTVDLVIARCDVISTVGSNMRLVGLFIK